MESRERCIALLVCWKVRTCISTHAALVSLISACRVARERRQRCSTHVANDRRDCATASLRFGSRELRAPRDPLWPVRNAQGLSDAPFAAPPRRRARRDCLRVRGWSPSSTHSRSWRRRSGWDQLAALPRLHGSQTSTPWVALGAHPRCDVLRKSPGSNPPSAVRLKRNGGVRFTSASRSVASRVKTRPAPRELQPGCSARTHVGRVAAPLVGSHPS
jgi:hypothetical protein